MMPASPRTSAQDGIVQVVVRLWRHLDGRRQRQLGWLWGLILLSALSEVVSLGALVPFLGILTSPDRVMNHPRLAYVVSGWGITSADELVVPLAVLFAIAAIVTGVLRLLLLWSTGRLAYGISGDFSSEIYRRTLYQPYPVHVGRNSSSVLSGITNKVNSATRMLTSLLNLIIDIMLLVAMTATLVAIHPTAATITGAGFGGSYLLASWAARRRLRHNGLVIVSEESHIIKIVQEGLGGIRDVLLDWTQPVYTEMYRRANTPLRRALGDNQFITAGPRYAMEMVGIVLVVGLAVWLSGTDGGLGASLPVLGVLALGGQRLLPVLQQAYASWSMIVSSVAPVSDVLDMLDQPLPPEAHLPAPTPLGLQREIRFEAVKFRYTSDGPWVLDGLSLSIPTGVRIGIVGTTGGGKSTLLDLLAGLLQPTEGAVLVDGLPITGERLRSWQRSVAHVPQNIYLSDSTIAENIAFGIPLRAIDMERVRKAAAEAQIADVIESRPGAYLAPIGERGIRLSSGERQRIGIARALYKSGCVLVFDEATSALDTTTEQSVMNTVERLSRDLTIVIIAHRVTTVRRCDRIVELIDGRAVEYQSYEQMIETSPSARQIFVAS